MDQVHRNETQPNDCSCAVFFVMFATHSMTKSRKKTIAKLRPVTAQCLPLETKNGPLCFIASNLRNINKIGIELGTNKLHFILNINLLETTLTNKIEPFVERQ